MRILVTGVSGFSGSYVARSLAASGYSVTGLYRRDTPFLGLTRAQPGLHLVRASLDSVADLPGPFAVVVHTAATSPALGVTNAVILRDNLEGTTALVEAAKRWKVQRFVFFSSLSVYGDVGPGILDEDTPILSPDVYGVSKRQCEALLAVSGLPSLSLRLPGVLGPGAHRNWLSGVAARLKESQTVHAFHPDSHFNNAVHIDDIAKLLNKALTHNWEGSDVVVLGARGGIPVLDAIKRLAKGLGVTPQIKIGPATKPSFTLSSQRAIMRWGYDPMEIGALIDRYAIETLDS
jgi:UDP-glucose 4-epimerase